MIDIKTKRKKITDYMFQVISALEPQENGVIWRDRLEKMTDQQFHFFMECLRDEKEVLFINTPNMKVTLNYDNIKKAAGLVGIDFFHNLKMVDSTTGVEFVTTNKCLILELPVRRMQQTIYEKMSIPLDDKKIDGLTGQVTGDDRACSITYPEIQALKAQGFKDTLTELVVSRGGNINAYAKMKQDLEDIGEGDLQNIIDSSSISRSTIILDVMLTSMGYETNLVTERQ